MRIAAIAAAMVVAGTVVSTSARAEHVISIGLVNDQTGPLAALGRSARRGMDMALAAAKSNPVFKDVTFKIVERDAAGKVADAVRYARDLAEREKVDVMMGGISSAECLALQQFAGEARIAYLVATGCWVDDFSEQPARVNRYSFRTMPNNKQRNTALVPWLEKNVGKRWYVLYSDMAYGQSGLKAFKEAGANVVGEIGIPFGATDVAPFVSKVDRSADGVYLIFAGRDSSLVLQEVLSQGISAKMKLAGMQSMILPEAFAKLPAAADGLTYIGAYPRDLSGPLNTSANQAFQKSFHAVAPDTPVGLCAFEAYVATNALLNAIEKSGFRGRADTDKLVGALETLDVPASSQFPSGRLTMRKEDHQGIVPLYIGVVKAGKEDVLQEIPDEEVARIR
jgi:branched-chain amino acid transport system substrate-binding protein